MGMGLRSGNMSPQSMSSQTQKVTTVESKRNHLKNITAGDLGIRRAMGPASQTSS